MYLVKRGKTYISEAKLKVILLYLIIHILVPILPTNNFIGTLQKASK